MSFQGDLDESDFKWHPTLIMTNIPHAKQPQEFYSLYLNILHWEARRVCRALSSGVVLCSFLLLPCAMDWQTASITAALAPTLLTMSESTISRQHVWDMSCLCTNPCHLVPGLNWYPASFSEGAVGCSEQLTLPKTFMISSSWSLLLSLLRIPAFSLSLPKAVLPSPALLQSSL